MKLLGGLFLGAIGIVLLLAGGSGSAQQLWATMFGKAAKVSPTNLPLTALLTKALTGNPSTPGPFTPPAPPASGMPGIPNPNTPGGPKTQGSSLAGVNTLTGQGVQA